MLLVLGRQDERMLKFVRRLNGNVKVTDKACELNKITERVTIIIPFEQVQDNGFVSNTKIFFDELFITCKVDRIIAAHITNKLRNTCQFYQVPLEELDFGS